MRGRRGNRSSNWWLMFGASFLGTALVTAILNPHLPAPGQTIFDWLVTALYFLLLFTGIFNLLLYVIRFALCSPWRPFPEKLGPSPQPSPKSRMGGRKAEGGWFMRAGGEWPVWEGVSVSAGETVSTDATRSLSSRYSESIMNDPAMTSRTAIVMPIYHEDADDIHRRIRQTWLSLKAADLENRFDFCLLSDSTDLRIQQAEERILHFLNAEFRRVPPLGATRSGRASSAPLTRARVNQDDLVDRQFEIANPNSHFHLSRRSDRKNFKAGNICAFLEKHGNRYDFMLVLDADSVMCGETIKRMILRMEASPKLAILQSTIVPIRAVTPFARAMQYSLGRTMPLYARGLFWFFGRQSVYWGHNALVRIAPFMEHARLPTLPGKPPLGGTILSQDIVEAALLGRAGWDVAWDVESGGSYDELPANILTYGKRDRRWCQGNFQHFPFIFWRGMKWGHRFYFANGIFAYLAGPLLLGLMLLGFIRSIDSPTPGGEIGFDVRVPALVFGMVALPRFLGLFRLFGVHRLNLRFTCAGDRVSTGRVSPGWAGWTPDRGTDNP